MPKYKVKSPDGQTYTVEAPEGATEAQILARVQSYAKSTARLPKPPPGWRNTAAGVAGNYLDGILPGASGFLRGSRDAAINALTAPFSSAVDFEPQKAYNEGRAKQVGDNRAAEQAAPLASGAAQGWGLIGGLLLPATKITKGASLAQKAKAGATTAGAYGAASGAMSSEKDTLAGKAEDAFSSAALSSMVGGAAPYAFKAAGAALAPFKPITDPIVRKAGQGVAALGHYVPGGVGRLMVAEGRQLARDPARAVANREIDEALRSTAHPATGARLRPMEAVDEVRRRQSLGVPAVAADLGEGVRSRFGTAARTPGPALQTVRRAIDERKQQEAARAAEHIAASLGPVGNIERQADVLNARARAAAAPLYELSDAHPIALGRELQELMSRPGGREAFQNAWRSLEDQGVNPLVDGVIQNPDGTWRAAQVPTMKVWDNVKTTLDDTVFAGQAPFAAPEVSRDMRGALSIRERLVALMDGDGLGPRVGPADRLGGSPTPSKFDVGPPPEGLNPYWKQAREAYAGPVQNRKALELGEDMAKADAIDAANRLEGMTASQLGHFRLGHRTGMADDVRRVSDYSDAAKRVAGSPRKRDAVRAVHGEEPTDALLSRLDAEMEAAQTWRAVRGGPRDAQANLGTQDQQIESAAGGILQVLAGQPGPGLRNVAGAVLKGQRGGERINAHVAEVLSEADPEKLAAFIRETQRERARRALVDQNAAITAQRTSRFLGDLVGTSMTEPVPAEGGY